MSRIANVVTLAGLCGCLLMAAEVVEPVRGDSLASKIGLQVFPAAGQSADQEFADEVACFDWAFGVVGADPFRLKAEVDKRRKQLPPKSSRNKTDRPAEYGNELELHRGKAQKTRASREQTDAFRRAFRVCLDSRNYTVAD
jgi:hypothetical protein